MNNNYKNRIFSELNNCLTETNLPKGNKKTGKVRDQYDLGDKIALITTDRQSAFDRVLASIPFKGQVLNQTSVWWFKKTEQIISNHLISMPDPNVIVAKKCDVIPIEFVVRGYITGSTSTSLWTVYNKGDREYVWITKRSETYDHAKDRTDTLPAQMPQDYSTVIKAAKDKGFKNVRILVIGSPGSGKTMSLRTLNKGDNNVKNNNNK